MKASADVSRSVWLDRCKRFECSTVAGGVVASHTVHVDCGLWNPFGIRGEELFASTTIAIRHDDSTRLTNWNIRSTNMSSVAVINELEVFTLYNMDTTHVIEMVLARRACRKSSSPSVPRIVL